MNRAGQKTATQRACSLTPHIRLTPGRNQPGAASPLGNYRGGVLLGLVAAMVLAGVLGAAAASMLGTSSLHGVRANYGERAYYLAESGFRYAASTLRRDVDAFWDLDEEEFIAAGGKFTLELTRLTEDEGFDAEAIVAGDQTISDNSGERNLQIAYGAQLAPRNGLFSHQGSWYRYREFSGDTLIEVIAATPNRREVQGAPTINEGDDLPLKPGSVIPASDHIFLHNGVEYSYGEFTGGALRNIIGDSDDFPLTLDEGELLHFPAVFPLEVQDQDELEFAPIIQVRSTGEYPGDDSGLNVARAVTYWFYDAAGFPLMMDEDSFAGGETHEDLADSLENWDPGPGKSLGEFVYDGDVGAIQVDGVQSGHGVASLAYTAGNIYSADYEAQVKLKLDPGLFVDDPKEYLLGITFRMDGEHKLSKVKGYGISFAKWDADWDPTGQEKSYDQIPATVVPDDYKDGANAGEPYVVLWRTNEKDGFNHDPELLAWAPAPTEALQANGLVKEWLTLLLRVEEITGDDGQPANRIHLMYGDPGGHPRRSSEDDPPLQWPPDQLDDPGNKFHLISWEDVDADGGAELVNGNLSIITAPGELLYNPEKPGLEVGLHAWGENMEGNAWFDNFAVREAGQGDGGGGVFGGGYIPPIQQ